MSTIDTTDGWAGKLLNGLGWMMVFAYINLLWIAFTFMGLIIFGISPATTALFAIVRKWLQGDRDLKILPTFWKIYKGDFLKANLLGLIIVVIGAVLYIDFYFLVAMQHWFSTVLLMLIAVFIALYLVILVHIIPVFVHYEASIWSHLKIALSVGVSHLGRTALLLFGSLIIFYLLLSYPGTIPFFSVSSLAAYTLLVSLNMYEKISQRHHTPVEE
ncbi:YesL family protein [Bacillus sp. JCM 19041]|uniref:YesL family protein n=1 Tax=Bacillus sp. JCM 19041 TaxID=1460637 RepID=UPI00336A5E3E